MRKIFTTKNIAGTAILSGLSALLYMFIKFPLPIFPAFLDIQVSEIPCLIAGYAFGPIFGGLSIIIRFLIKLPFSATGMVGELGDLIIGLFLVVPASIFYKKDRTFKGAIKSFIIGMILSVIAAIIVNIKILIPFYINFMEISVEGLVNMCSMIKGITVENFMKYYILFAIIPFNILRYILVGIFTFILYKRIKFLLDKIK